MIKDHVYPKTYTKDWTTLGRTDHVRLDRERSNRMLEVRRDDFVTLALKVIEKDKWYLLMNSGATLVANSHSIITVLTKKMRVTKIKKIHWDLGEDYESIRNS